MGGVGEMTAREQAEQAMQSMLAGALDSNILDDQFMQLRNLQVCVYVGGTRTIQGMYS